MKNVSASVRPIKEIDCVIISLIGDDNPTKVLFLQYLRIYNHRSSGRHSGWIISTIATADSHL